MANRSRKKYFESQQAPQGHLSPSICGGLEKRGGRLVRGVMVNFVST